MYFIKSLSAEKLIKTLGCNAFLEIERPPDGMAEVEKAT